MKKQFLLPLAAILIACPAFARPYSGAASIQLSTTALSFNGSSGNVSSQPLTITVTGTQPVTIRSISISNSTFSVPSISLPVTLSTGQSVTGKVSAQPRSTAQTGTLTIGTNVGTYTVSLTETGTVASTSHQVNLSWKAPSTTPVAIDSYQVNRAVSGSNQYSVVGTTTADSTAFTDTSVQSGQTYVYEVLSVAESGNTSNPSNTVTLSIP